MGVDGDELLVPGVYVGVESWLWEWSGDGLGFQVEIVLAVDDNHF